MTDCWTRRRILAAGSAAFGVSLPRLLRAERDGSSRLAAPARSVIVLYLSGGPSQLDMWDLKPEAPAEVRGTFQPVSTTVAGTQICEHLPRMARLAHRYAIVRSMSHDENDHLKAGYWVLTGGRLIRPIVQASGMQRNDRPHLGAVVSRSLGSRESLPPFVTVPEFVSPVGVPRPGQHAGFLGARFDPYLLATDPNTPQYSPGPIARSRDLTGSRLEMLARLAQANEVGGGARWNGSEFDEYRQQALELIRSPAAQEAFDLSQESTATRERYGRHTFGQSTLVARRLVEAGVRVVQVNFERHDRGKGGQGYDSHSVPPSPPHLGWLRDELLPPTDAAFSSLIEDLADRGLLDETLVVMMGEFGRTPRFNSTGGRDHWSRCYSLVIAGGGVAPGLVYGSSDSLAANPTTEPVSPDDLLATVYQQLGIPPHQLIHDLQDRPQPLCDGWPVDGLLA